MGFGREVILGLLAEEPSNCYQLDRRPAERFGSAGYTHGMARQAIKRLVDEGLVRVVDVDERVAFGDYVRARTTIYESTPTGAERFQKWMWASVSTPPVREELHAKIALCRAADLPRLVDVVREAEAICAGKRQGLNWRVRSRRRDLDPRTSVCGWIWSSAPVIRHGGTAGSSGCSRFACTWKNELRRCQPESFSRTVIRQIV
jgi:DNA-binding PadR family transcriptional regulator